jgi:filamentous hemagglutinin
MNKNDERFSSPLTRSTCYFLIYLTGIYPLNSAIAGGITPDNLQTQVQNKDNVPVVNIATPNEAGVSHNIYKDFNTGVQGAVLNNATQAVNSQLAGQISANVNLHGKAADLIINEVTGSSRSELLGQLEIAGQKANVMIANPNGITCDGCGFINTSGAILTTGKPQFDKNGVLDALTVTKGQITIGGKGVNGQSIDYLDIISRATELNGKIQTNQLTFTQGANQVSFKDGSANSITGEGAAPKIAVDTKALGGMYANKIRLIATENGVGVNLKDITSTQGDIAISASGKMELLNIKSKTDIHAVAKEISIAPNNTLQAENNIFLNGEKINNKGRVIAGQDMKIYSNTVNNIGTQALLQANNNMLIQKNSNREKSDIIENKSGEIRTNNGDLFIRAHHLNNIRDYYFTQRKFTEKELKEKKAIEDKARKEKEECTFLCFDFSSITESFDRWEEKPLEKGRVILNLKPATIISGGNIYINSDILNNIDSNIISEKDILLTGHELKNGRRLNSVRTTGKYNNPFYFTVSNSPIIPTSTYEYYSKGYGDLYKKDSKPTDWYEWDNKNISLIDSGDSYSNYLNIIKDIGNEDTKISAKGNIVADFKSRIEIINKVDDPYHKVFEESLPSALSGKNILLKSKERIFIKDKIKATENISIISDANIRIIDTTINALKDLVVVSFDKIEGVSSKLKGKNININSFKGDISFKNAPMIWNKKEQNTYDDENKDIFLDENNIKSVDYDTMPGLFDSMYSPYGKVAEINSSDSLIINSGNNLLLKEIIFPKNIRTELTTINDINIINESMVATCIEKCNEKSEVARIYKSEIPQNNIIKSSKLISMNSGGDINLKGVTLLTDGDINVNSIKNINLYPKYDLYSPYNISFERNDNQYGPADSYYTNVGHTPDEIGTRFFARNGLISSGGDVIAKNVQFNIKNNLFIHSGRNIELFPGEYENRRPENKDSSFINKKFSFSNIHADNDLTIFANNIISTIAAKLSSGGNLTLSSGGDIGFEAANDYSETTSIFNKDGFLLPEDKSFKTTPQSTELSSNGNLIILTQGNLLFQATKLVSKGTMNIAAKGGYLYAQAQEDISHYTTKKTHRKWYGKKKTSTTTHHNVTNKVTQFIADGDINLLSHDDSTYEASKIETNKNAILTSTHGKINFKAVQDTDFEQTISQSKGFFIKNQDKGYSKDTWILPSVYVGGKLTIDAAEGISAVIKTQKGQSLQAALATLGNTPETTWLKNLNQHQDIHWNEVQDAYENWDHKSQQLSPAASAVIAIAVAVVTAGSSFAISAAESAATTASGAATTIGAGTTTATTIGTMASGATIAGISSLASKAAIVLVKNQGNISKTFKELGDSDTVKSTITSMAIGGALAGFDYAMGWGKAAEGANGTNAGVSTTAPKVPLLNNGAEWTTIAQRVAGHSIISSGLNTTINGGSFKDNFAAALLNNVGNQINMEGANYIGVNGIKLDPFEKALGHSAIAAISAEISGGDAKGAAAGAFAVEFAANLGILDNIFNKDPGKILAGSKVVGGLVGALTTNREQGAYSGSNSAGIAIEYNYLHVDQALDFDKEIQECRNTGGNCLNVINKWHKISDEQSANVDKNIKDAPLVALGWDKELALGGIQALERPKWVGNIFGLDVIRNEDVKEYVQYWNSVDINKIDQNTPGWAKFATFISEPENMFGLVALGILGKELSKTAISYMGRNTATATVSAEKIGMAWGQGNVKQGIPWEDYVGTKLPLDTRLPKNFKTFDYYNGTTKTAISVKSLDTQTMAKLTKPNQIYSSIKGNIDKAAKFTDYSLSRRTLDASMIANKEIQLAIPANTTKTQWLEVNRAIEYGKAKGVKVIVTQVN